MIFCLLDASCLHLNLDFLNTEYTYRGRQASLQHLCFVHSHVLWQDKTKEHLSWVSCYDDKKKSALANPLSLENGYTDVIFYLSIYGMTGSACTLSVRGQCLSNTTTVSVYLYCLYRL